MKSKSLSSALAVWTVVLALVVPIDGAERKPRRVRFARGRTTAILKGAIVRGESDGYLLGARAGQTMIVHLTSLEENAAFSIIAPGEEAPLEGAEEATDWTGELPASGDYLITVAPTRGNATYTLEVTIR